MAQSHVVVVTFPFCSHPMCLFGLTHAMASLASSSRFSFFSTAHSLSSLNRSQLPSLIPISDGITPPHMPTEFEAIELFYKSFKDSLRGALNTAEVTQGCKVSCIVTDSWLWPAADLANEMAVKLIPVVAASPHDLYARFNADSVRGSVDFGDKGSISLGLANGSDLDKVVSFFPSDCNNSEMDLWNGIFAGDKNLVIHKILGQVTHFLSESDKLVLNGIEEFDPTLDSYFRQKFAMYFPVGPLRLLNQSQNEPPRDSYGCLSWLDRHEPATVVYICTGTVASLSPTELTSLANALEDSGVPFLWSLREDMQSMLPAGFIHRTNAKWKIVPWAPQISVLKHSAVALFVSHCGWNSVLESMAAGVPLMCRPFSGDQVVNARVISNVWKSGVTLAEEGCFTEKGIIEAFDMILKSDEGKMMKNKVQELKAKVAAAIEENGCSRENLKRLLKFVCG